MNQRMTDNISEIMELEAPYLYAKLLSLGLAETRKEAASLFQEVKKYLVLGERYGARSLPMFSVRIDEIWHQFVLFTAEYAEFCAHFAGRFLHHVPQESERTAGDPQSVTFAEFRADYEARFGTLDSSWLDELSLRGATRLAPSARVLPLDVELHNQAALLVHSGSRRMVVCRTSKRGADALRFIAREPRFLVRELPGLRHDHERIALCKPLVKFGVLRLAP